MRPKTATPPAPAAAVVLIIFLVGCGTPPRSGLRHALLSLDVPPRRVAGVSERWVVARHRERAFLVHAIDVERRRAQTTCGVVPPEAFRAGWEELGAAGLLEPGRDPRLAPPGTGPLPARFAAEFVDGPRRVSVERPVTGAGARRLLRVLRGWEATLAPADPGAFPADVSVEIGVGGCAPRPPPAGRPRGR